MPNGSNWKKSAEKGGKGRKRAEKSRKGQKRVEMANKEERRQIKKADNRKQKRMKMKAISVQWQQL